MNPFTRIEALVGEKFPLISKARVAIVGLGGVGSHAAMALARTGIEGLILMDPDEIKTSNFNRHAQGFSRYLGKNKTLALKDEILSFRDMDIKTLEIYFNEENKELLFKEKFDYLIDCIDLVTYKLVLIEECQKRGINFISSLGTGNRLRPDELVVSSLYNTSGCPLARVLRREARKNGLEDFPVVFSKEKAPKLVLEEKEGSRHLPASSYFTPAAAGMLLAYWVIEQIISTNKDDDF